MSRVPRVGLFVTCLVDSMRPEIGFATLDLLERAGCEVVVPEAQTCCGQPALNSGARDLAADIAKQVIDAFAGVDWLVAPSGSCLGTIKHHYARLLDDDPRWASRHKELAGRSVELLTFLDEVMGFSPEGIAYPGVAAYHDSCSGLRELGIREQPRRLLARVEGLRLVPIEGQEACCGFGGTFCVKYPEISTSIVDDKVRAIERAGADTVIGGDLGCLMNIAGRLARKASPIRVFHTAEILAGHTETPLVAPAEAA